MPRYRNPWRRRWKGGREYGETSACHCAKGARGHLPDSEHAQVAVHRENGLVLQQRGGINLPRSPPA